MKYLIVISDTHGRVEKLKNLLPIINDADYLIFLGDCTGDLYPLKRNHRSDNSGKRQLRRH